MGVAKKRNKIEDTLQEEVVAWFNRVYPQYYNLFFAVPNGGHRSPAVGKSLRKMGTKRGIPDLFLDVTSEIEGQFYSGLRAEIKPDKRIVRRYPSAEQKVVITQMNYQGYYARVLYGIDEIKSTIKWYLSGKLQPIPMPEHSSLFDKPKRAK